MNRFSVVVSFAATCAVFAFTSSSARAVERPVISVANASQLGKLSEAPNKVVKILPGPAAGEMSFFYLNDVVEIVDDLNFGSLRKLAEQSKPSDFRITRDGKFAAWHPERTQTYVVRDLTLGTDVEIKLEKGSPGNAAFSQDGKFVAIGDTFWSPNAEGEGDSELKLFEITGKLVRTFKSPGPGAITPLFSPDGRTIVVGNRNRETLIYDVDTGKLLHTLPRKMTHEIAFSPDGKVLAAGYVDGSVVVWNISTGEAQHTRTGVAKEISTLDWSAKGDLLVTAGRGENITVWDTNAMTVLKQLPSPDWVMSVRFTADGTRLVTAGGTGYGRDAIRKVTVWAVQDGAPK